MKKVKKIVICAVAVIAIIGSIVVKNNLTSNSKVQAVVNKTAVEVQDVKTSEKNSGDTYKANIEAYQQGVITTKISAKVISVSVENGQYVNEGDTIATLDAQDIQNSIKSAQGQLQIYEQQLNASKASLEKLEINVDDAERNYGRQKTLFEAGAISQTDFQAAEKTLNTAKADYNSGLASVESSKANIALQNVTISNYQDNLNNTVIKAPISGVISDKSLIVGQMASQGSTLAKINDITFVYAVIKVPQDNISKVKIGQAAEVTVDGVETIFNGVVENIDLSADVTSRVFNCKIKIDNSDKLLLPGIYGKTELISGEKVEIITVPINALVGNEGNYSVFINEDGVAKKQEVLIGETDGNNVEITSGLEDGNEVICSNTGTLQDGAQIDVVYNDSNNSLETNSGQNDDVTEDVSK